jgi:hypothetical protein
MKFLGSYIRVYFFASSSSLSRLVYLFIGRTPRVIAFNANSVRQSVVFVLSSFSSQIMSYILNMLICVDMIFLDNLLQCLLFIAVRDLLELVIVLLL